MSFSVVTQGERLAVEVPLELHALGRIQQALLTRAAVLLQEQAARRLDLVSVDLDMLFESERMIKICDRLEGARLSLIDAESGG